MLQKMQTVEELEQEITLRDTFELFDVEQRGGLDLELFSLLMHQVRGVVPAGPRAAAHAGLVRSHPSLPSRRLLR